MSVKRQPLATGRTFVAITCTTFAALLLSACGSGRSKATEQTATGTSSSAGTGAVKSISSAALTANVCISTGAHDKHAAAGYLCTVCHPCGGGLGFSPDFTLPSGTKIAGGQILPAGAETTCVVACHSPFSSTPTSVTWSATGSVPLACGACHSGVVGSVSPVASAHAGTVSDQGSCTWCHDLTQHKSGKVNLLAGSTSTACTDCHSGKGKTFGGQAPPVLVGWTDTVNGDWHGARGAQAALSCESCHDFHASSNAFLIAPVVNGARVDPSKVNRAGVGAEALCNACHKTERHAYCKTCHTDKRAPRGGYDLTGNRVDPEPAGSPCFYCHGHEGVRIFPSPEMTHGMYPPWDQTCQHCHPSDPNGWRPVVSAQPPAWVVQPYSGPVSSDSAIISWQTYDKDGSTSWVEYGVGTPDHVSGSSSMTNQHSVPLTGLAPNTTYSWRVKSSNASRNVLTSDIRTFTTPAADAPAPPAILPTADQSVYSYNSLWAPLVWNAVAAPAGLPIQYQAQIGSDPTFSLLVNAAFNVTAVPQLAPVSPWQSALAVNGYVFGLPEPDCLYGIIGNPVRYYWRVRAQDTQGQVSGWSAIGAFSAYATIGWGDCSW